MAASKNDIDELESALQWVRTTKVTESARITTLVMALGKAIRMLRDAHKTDNNPGFWVLGAFHDSIRRGTEDKKFVVVNPSLYEWACEQLEQLYGPLNRIEGYRQSFNKTDHPNRRREDDAES